MPQWVTLPWQSDMQLTGKLVLSAPALLLLTLAFRFYKSRSLAGAKTPPVESRGEQRGDAAGAGDGGGGDGGDGDGGDGAAGLRLRRVCGGEGRRGSGQGNVPGMLVPSQEDQRVRRGEEGKEGGEEMVSELGLTCGRVRMAGRESEMGGGKENEMGGGKENEMGSELGRKPGINQESDPGSKPQNEPESKLGSKPGIKQERDPGSELGNEPGSKLGSEPGIELGSELGNELGSELGSKLRSELECELGSELGSKLVNKSGSKLVKKSGSKLNTYDPGKAAETLSSLREEDTFAPTPGVANAQVAGDGCAQSTEQDLAVGGMSQQAEGRREVLQTLSVTSDLGLTMTESNVGSYASYSFSSVAKIQVEENYITKKQMKDGAAQTAPGLKGKVYDYYVQSISQSVLEKRSLPYTLLGTSWHHSSEQLCGDLQSFATKQPDPALAMQDPITSSIVSPPKGSLEISPEPPSPGRKDSILQIADTPHLQLPIDGFGVTIPACTPPTSPQPGLMATTDLFQIPPPVHLDLGNCYEVLCTAKVQKVTHLQEAAYKVMSDNYLQVLRTPSIYNRLNAAERELILQGRMKGKMYVAVADINVQEPGLHSSRLCYYDTGGDSWHQLCHVPPEVVSQGCAMCSMFNYLFVVAGCEVTGRTQRPSNRVFCYDPLTNIWREICPLNQARPHCKLVALDGHLYAIGGECLYTVERYDPRQDRWTFTSPLPHNTFAVAHTATVCDGEIYVTGGTLHYVLLRYAASSDSWRVSPASGAKDRTVEMVSANGFIYRFDLHRAVGVSVYRCGAKAKLWYECAAYAMPKPSGFQCAVVGNLVHCISRHFHVRFLADHISPRFGTKELQPFPSPRGSLLPTVLVLPGGGTSQTQV